MTAPTLPAARDICLPFSLEGRDVKGRILRLDHSLDQVLNRHDYVAPASVQLGEAMLLAALLGSMMKHEGILTIQIKADHRLRFLVSDFATDGTADGGVVRGYAQYDEGAARPSAEPDFPAKGYMAITLDQGRHMDRYQGIVDLKGGSLAETAGEYFRTSEQLPSQVKIACEQDKDGRWRGAAVIIQHLARNSDAERRRNPEQENLAEEKNAEEKIAEEELTEDWRNATALLASLTEAELLDPALPLEDILFRLYHEGGVRVYPAVGMRHGCRCSENKLRQVLSNFNRDDLTHMAEEGVITMDCEFCRTRHRFALNKLIH